MENSTPTNKKNYTFNRTPTLKERRWNTLNVSNTSVRCSTPIFGDFRSPNLSPIAGMGPKKSPCSPPRFEAFKKPPTKMCLQLPRKHHEKRIDRTQMKPPIFVLPQSPEEIAEEEREREREREMKSTSNSSSCSDTCSDDSESSLIVESRRRSLVASNHSYVVNHARTVEQVLVHIGLEHYVRHFEKAHIDMVSLASMKRDDLAKMGLNADEDCNRILDAINAL